MKSTISKHRMRKFSPSLVERILISLRKKQLKDRVKKWGFVKNKKGGVGSSSHKSTFLESGNDVDGSLRKLIPVSRSR